MTEQFNIRLSDQWYIDKLNDLSDRTGMTRIRVARELLIAAIERCYPKEQPVTEPGHENLMDIYNDGSFRFTQYECQLHPGPEGFYDTRNYQ